MSEELGTLNNGVVLYSKSLNGIYKIYNLDGFGYRTYHTSRSFEYALEEKLERCAQLGLYLNPVKPID